MINNWKLISGLFLLLLISSFPASALEKAVPKNIILLIGDGMGIAQITAGKIVKKHLNLEEFKQLGLLMTHSGNALVTDSAASGTAMATGYKTDNKAISVSHDDEPLKTVIEYAQEVNKVTGLVVTSSITHATPAVFAAHVKSRKNQTLIAEQLSKSGVDVLLGGGWGYFVPNTTKGSFRNDHKNLLVELAEHTIVIQTEKEFNELGDVDSVVGLFARKALPGADQRSPGLSEMTQKAIQILSKNQKGFFLMVEGSQIDWAGHDNDADGIIREMIDFDNAIGIALDFAKNNNETLVLVTADHETGGFAIHDGSVTKQQITETQFTQSDHTAEMVPVFAYGPGASDFTGIGDNTKIGKLLIHYLQIHPLK